MQLKIQRSQRQGGVISKSVIFCLDARAEFTASEKQSIARYKLQNEVIYNSEAQLRLLEKSNAQRDGSIGGGLKSLATIAFAHTKLHITIGSLERGQHVECKSLEELIGAEDAMLAACQNLKAYLDTALTFDGGEVLYDFSTGVPQVVAQTITPQPMLAAPATHPKPATAPSPAILTVDQPAPGEAEPEADEEAPTSSNWNSPLGLYLAMLLPTASKRYAAAAISIFVLVIVLRACAP